MRITGGAARGIPLKAPSGDATRPATDKVRQALFSRLGDRVVGARFVDLYAGTGSYGLEAFSRGAAGGVFVENQRPALGALRSNIAAVARSAVRGEEALRVVPADVLGAWTHAEPGPFDLVFTDPPYAIVAGVLSDLADLAARWVRPGTGVWVLESPSSVTPPVGWVVERRLGAERGDGPGVWLLLRPAGPMGR